MTKMKVTVSEETPVRDGAYPGWHDVYEQIVENLDIQRVIAAVNPPPVVEVKRRHRKGEAALGA